MAKKGFGKIATLAVIAGAAAAGISYLKKYKSFNDELEEEFHDFEGNEEDDDDLFEEDETVTIMDEDETDSSETQEQKKEHTSSQETSDQEKNEGTTDPRASRKYIPLNVSKDELKLAAKDMVSAAGEIAGAAKSVLKDAAVILGDTAYEAAIAAKDTAQIARAKLSERAELHRNRQNGEPSASDADTSSPADDCNDEPEKPAKAEAIVKETDAEKARQETAAAQFAPNALAGAASLETEADDSTVEIVTPEDAQKIISQAENSTAADNVTIEELT